MRNIRPVLVSLGLLAFSVGSATAQNVCVHAADGAIVCGPVAPENKSSANPFDQPQPGMTQPIMPSYPAAAPPSAPPNRAVRKVNRDFPPSKRAYREPPPRELERHPPRRVVREDVHRRQAERDLPPPRRAERDLPPPRPGAQEFPPPRRAERDLPPPRRVADRHPPDRYRERPFAPPERGMDARRYDERLNELERELRALRGERERYAMPQRPPRRVDRDRYSNED